MGGGCEEFAERPGQCKLLAVLELLNGSFDTAGILPNRVNKTISDRVLQACFAEMVSIGGGVRLGATSTAAGVKWLYVIKAVATEKMLRLLCS